MTSLVIFLCAHCANSSCVSWHNQFTKTKFSRSNTKISKSTHYRLKMNRNVSGSSRVELCILWIQGWPKRLVLLVCVKLASCHHLHLQGDTSGCSQGSEDIKTKVPFLVWRVDTITQLWCWCQQNLENNLTCHPVHTGFSNKLEIKVGTNVPTLLLVYGGYQNICSNLAFCLLELTVYKVL